MIEDFPGVSDRLQACGYGVPYEWLACECAEHRATIVVEDEMPNAVVEHERKKTTPKRADTSITEPKHRRKVKLYRLPLPDSLLTLDDPEVELRVTLSYFSEPNKYGRRSYRGLDLKWDMQGPRESEEAFLQRINRKERPLNQDGKRQRDERSNSFDWVVGVQRRSRGTVQSDRWRGRMSDLAGDKWIAVIPVLGWWDQRKALRTQALRFSLVISVSGPGVYAAIKPRVEVGVEV